MCGGCEGCRVGMGVCRGVYVGDGVSICRGGWG